MNTMDFLAKWPGWSNKTPAELLSSPAWAMRVRWGDDEVLLRISDNRPRDIVALKIALDGEEHFLGIGQRDAFPDLSALWSRKDEIPQTLVLALVEKECGKLLQLIENAVRRQLTVIGLTDAIGPIPMALKSSVKTAPLLFHSPLISLQWLKNHWAILPLST